MARSALPSPELLSVRLNEGKSKRDIPELQPETQSATPVAATILQAPRPLLDQNASRIEDAQKAQMTNEAGMSKGATAGSIAIATGCVAASALGQAYIALPCVLGGALYTGAVKLAH